MTTAPGDASLVSSMNTEENEFYDASSFRQDSTSAALFLSASGATMSDEQDEGGDIYIQDNRRRPLRQEDDNHNHDPTFKTNNIDYIQTNNRYSHHRATSNEYKREEVEEDCLNLSVSGSVKYKEQGAAAADAMFSAFWPIKNKKRYSNDTLNESSNDYRHTNSQTKSHQNNETDEIMLYSPTSNASSMRKRGSVSQRGRRRGDFQRQRRETKSALLENLPWRMEIMAILLAVLAGLFVLGIMIGLVLILLTSGTTFRPKYGV
mmetsp:Transcript_21044/g.32104  ORF Transcript_21044/g.32104 Transcript_21044/m.32104 type:complete len:263 (-) Transcript_21044:201-989(-)|eukprot:CAMPEP_0196827488 /NCGR_PEP_ID=MMETSP1362-20130617/94186_1 /TAXON_ID=163516 /ORGANISM="Leptocylindrus danicus, Strain CCMP1856" /LENGTH=262 /DNA_ID=CAMNT_0042208127 /DNA_START=114 /DNA_END=902 /DNA_ORIENTATION=-